MVSCKEEIMTKQSEDKGAINEKLAMPTVKIPGKIEKIAVEKLKEYSRNARKHSEAQVLQIVDSVKLAGWTQPIIIDKSNEIIAGHGRLEAAKRLGMKTVPCIRVDVTKKVARALRLADNKIALNSRWDSKELRLELTALKNEDFDLSLTGFDFDELADFQLDVEPDEEGVTKLEPVTDSGRKIKVRGHTRVSKDGDHSVECPECGHKFNPNDKEDD